MLTLTTERLQLVPCSAEAARAILDDRSYAERLIGAALHPAYPGGDIRSFLPYYAQQLENDPDMLGWGLWLTIHRADGLVIGDVGFKGKPDASGTVDIGYSVVEPYRRRGYTFEAARALRDWAFAQPGVTRLTGDCLPDNIGSARILQKLGMSRCGASREGLLLWEMSAVSSGASRKEAET